MLRDDVIEYSLDGHHSEEAGKKIRAKIWKVTALLTAITLVEVLLGVYIKQGSGLWPFVKWTFIALTLLKAAYIVLIFMHLGDEKKSLKYIVLVPYFLFMLYLIFIALMEALAVGDAWATYGG
ncbi:MAG: cytochrome C oxidase subunit IV family protein [Crocinitomicaceae bacterium]|jgi:cytochrome c oxidase subunit 4|nr:cytochrome C oxidase subunit IV family protein [Crocinitomicaceae bacterium]MCF8433099.1 cytochrome C oxidase subunit IV family protein [Crocinitomicaceae bacterium]